jgi:hypothetical protein
MKTLHAARRQHELADRTRVVELPRSVNRKEVHVRRNAETSKAR